MTSVHDLRVVTLPCFRDNLGNLVVIEEKTNFPNIIKRVFVVSGSLGAVRGKHAHKELTQTLVCVHGSCTVICDDGQERKEFLLDELEKALEIPPGIWAEQIYSSAETVLLVMCDLPFDEKDYIRDYKKFISYRKEKLT